MIREYIAGFRNYMGLRRVNRDLVVARQNLERVAVCASAPDISSEGGRTIWPSRKEIDYVVSRYAKLVEQRKYLLSA